MEQSKPCTQCAEAKPLSEFYARAKGGYLASECKTCARARMAAVRLARGMAPREQLPRTDTAKTCPVCRTLIDLSQFTSPGAAREYANCKACRTERNRRYRQQNAEHLNALKRQRYACEFDPERARRCPRCDETKPQAEFAADGRGGYCRPCRAAYARERNARRRDLVRQERYGFTPQQFAQLLAKQGGGCAICGRTEVVNGRWKSSDARDLHVDHDHTTGAVRGLLCNQCNPALGMLQDNPDLLIRAAEYLKNPPAMN